MAKPERYLTDIDLPLDLQLPGIEGVLPIPHGGDDYSDAAEMRIRELMRQRDGVPPVPGKGDELGIYGVPGGSSWNWHPIAPADPESKKAWSKGGKVLDLRLEKDSSSVRRKKNQEPGKDKTT